jgi:hypothetical protein
MRACYLVVYKVLLRFSKTDLLSGGFMIQRLSFLILLAAYSCSNVGAAEKEGIKFDDQITVNGIKLELNCLGTRRVTRFGIPGIRVYVGGFYLPKKTMVREVVGTLPRPILLQMEFMRSVDEADIAEGWKEGFKKNCDADCDKAKDGLTEFVKLISDARKGSRFEVKITDDGVEVDSQMRSPKKATIKNPSFANAVIQVFFGKHPLDEQLQQELLCQNKR